MGEAKIIYFTCLNNFTKEIKMERTVDIRPLQSGDVSQIVPLLAENYKTQAFRKAFF